MKKAMIFAAGLGTRLKPLTDRMPKALVPYKGVPMLERLILKLKDAGFGTLTVNVHHFADQIEEFLNSRENFGLEIRLSDERDLLRETGGGIRHARRLLQENPEDRSPILIHNVDIQSDIDLAAFYEQGCRQHAAASLLVSDRKSSRNLLFEPEGDLRLRGWTNLNTGEVKSPLGRIDPKDYRGLAFSGIHLLSPDVFPLMEDWPEKFSIIDFYLSVSAGQRIMGIEAPEGSRIRDIGKLEQLEISSF